MKHHRSVRCSTDRIRKGRVSRHLDNHLNVGIFALPLATFSFAVLCLVFPFSYEQNLTSRTHFFTSAPLMRQTYIKFVLKVERVKNLINVYIGLLASQNRGEWNENARKGIEKG